ncbi:hypothetical protein ACVBEQ_05955 [Nakamurella sp. GG22]
MRRHLLVVLLVIAGLVAPATGVSAAGWRTVFYDNFVTAVPKGQFPGAAYGTTWRAWHTDRDGFGDIHKIAKYDADRTVSVANGYLTIDLRTVAGQAYSAALMPQRSGGHVSQSYGRWVMKWKAVPYSAGAQGWGWASLLWPDSNDWADGEVDWPEIYGGTSPNVLGYNHCVAATGREPWEKCGINVNTFQPWLNVWHETMVVWTPTTLEMWMDGKRYGATSGVNVPTASLHQVIQTGSASWTAPCATCSVKINIDFVRIDRYQP